MKQPAAPFQWHRAAAFAGTSALLSAIAHSSAGGALPNVWLMLVGTAALVPAAHLGLAREAGWTRILLALGLAQGALHAWLQLAAGSHHAHASHNSTLKMLTAHAVGTLAAAAWLRYGEQRVWAAARRRWLSAVLGRIDRPVLVVRDRMAPSPVRRAPVVLYLDVVPKVYGMRGPPPMPVRA